MNEHLLEIIFSWELIEILLNNRWGKVEVYPLSGPLLLSRDFLWPWGPLIVLLFLHRLYRWFPNQTLLLLIVPPLLFIHLLSQTKEIKRGMPLDLLLNWNGVLIRWTSSQHLLL